MNKITSVAFSLPGIIVLFCLISLLTFDLIEEDAYIYFRFAANIANGFGYVFNQAGPAVESGSSLIWQFLLVPLYFIDPEMVLGTKLMGIGFGILALLMTHKIAVCYIKDKRLSLLPPLWLACSYPFYLWSHLGLETPMFLFIALCFVYCLINERLIRYWPLLAVLLVFGRPEGFMFCAVLLPVLLKKQGEKPQFNQGLLFLAVVATIELMRALYFNDLVPHSFYHKIKANNHSTAKLLWQFFSHSLIIFPLFLALIPLCIPRLYSYKICILFMALGITLVWAALGADTKLYSRSFYMLLPFTYILATITLEALSPKKPFYNSIILMLLIIFSALLLFFSQTNYKRNKFSNPLKELVGEQLSSDLSLTARMQHLFTPHKHLPRKQEDIIWRPKSFLYDNHQVITGEFLAMNYPKGIRVVYDQMGQTPWYAGLDKHFIDSLGLVDKPIGYAMFNEKLGNSGFLQLFNMLSSPIIEALSGEDRSQWNKQSAVDYIFEQEPEVIMLHGIITRRFPGSIPGMLLNDQRLAKFYSHKYSINFTQVYERENLQREHQAIIFPENCVCKKIDTP